MIEPLGSLPPVTEYRPLTTEEIASLRPIFEAQGVGLPSGIYMGAVEGSRVIGFLVLQLKLHSEPMWIEPGRSQIFHALVGAAENYILANSGPTWVYLFAPEGRVSELAEAMGMTRNDEQIYYKLIERPTPPRPFVDLQPIPVEVTPEDIARMEAAYQSAMVGHDLRENPFDDTIIPETIQ
jgi:hypothetical protein